MPKKNESCVRHKSMLPNKIPNKTAFVNSLQIHFVVEIESVSHLGGWSSTPAFQMEP